MSARIHSWRSHLVETGVDLPELYRRADQPLFQSIRSFGAKSIKLRNRIVSVWTELTMEDRRMLDILVVTMPILSTYCLQ
jgi:hypothetical protein